MFELDDLSVTRDGREILHVGRLSLGTEGVTAVLGHNGSGKSTLMALLARQIRPDAGRIALEGRALDGYRQRDLARRVSFLPQRLPPVAGLNMRDLVGLGRFAWRGALGRMGARDHAVIAQAMLDTGCEALADHLVDTASGGERQRAWIAMLLAQEAPALLLDEPTAALDLAHAYEVMALLHRLSRVAKRRVVVILHDVNLAARYADRIVALKQGHVTFDGPPRAFLDPEVLRSLYGIEMTILPHPDGHPQAAVA
ncbi:iron complex transport system ATP-binding protein [Roseovarius azorensis]|uniref:Iron complex transport system ATP-binding protein n=1 Tax=Roseovarius azorensis TaxID=1287727 RepID=A0A1H7LZW3_9RHOB|nr:ABC transporter ATP-binding protein [Roseovarius azorensis]SEL04513.1 iron complex transport system ATP-binding protein [Roseovarius azorensis]